MLSRCSLPQYFTGAAKGFTTGSSCKPGTSATTLRSLSASHSPEIIRRPGKRIPSCRNLTGHRCFSNDQSSVSQKPKDPGSNSIFSKKESAWDHVFSDIQDTSPLAPPTTPQATRGQGRRQAMTAREISAFDEMFEMIFDATGASKPGSSTSQENVGVGRGDISDLLGKLRTHSKKMRWTSEVDEALDLKKEEMDMCETDHQLLEWAMREVFEESTKYEEAARKAISVAAESQTSVDLPPLQPPAYPHLLAYLIHTFRDKYNDPHLALAMFDHARHLSIASYVFGCSTQAYNELIETRWTCFYDVKGVHDALQEMAVNGVDVDSRTRRLVEMVRREATQRDLWVEESQLGSGEVMRLLTKIDKLAAKPPSRSRKANTSITTSAQPKNPAKWGDWKATPLEDKADDQWGFDQWNKPNRRDKGPLDRTRQRVFEGDRRDDRRRPFDAFIR